MKRVFLLIIPLVLAAAAVLRADTPAPLESGAAADLLSASGFALRGGLHCAPSTHTLLGTLDRGALRASPGPFSTEDEIDQFLRKVHTLCTG